jgi:uncharacterized membrane protein
MNLSQKQSKAVQIALGIASGIGIMASLFAFSDSQYENTIFQWLWVILFAVVMITQKQLEKKFQTRFVFFFRAYMISLIVTLAVFVIFAVATGKFSTTA